MLPVPKTLLDFGQPVLPLWVNILKAQFFMFLGVVFMRNSTRRFGGWRTERLRWRISVTIKKSDKERTIWCF